jgi:hypothetical protein
VNDRVLVLAQLSFESMILAMTELNGPDPVGVQVSVEAPLLEQPVGRPLQR